MYVKILGQLKDLNHKELLKLRGSLRTEIQYRESLEPIAWECPGCGFSAPSWAEIVNHAKDKHNFESTCREYGISYPPKAVWP